MGRLLLIEDEPLLRASWARALAKIPSVDVIDVGTVGAAVSALDAGPPAFIVSDIDLPDRSGIELLYELDRREIRVPILFVSAFMSLYEAAIPMRREIEVREKPIALAELRAIVQSKIADRAESDAPFGVCDYIQLACMGRRSVVINVDARGSKGAVVIHEGTVWTAWDAEGKGLDALRRLAFSRGTAAKPVALRDAPGERTIEGHWEGVLLEAARQADEAAHVEEAALDALGGDDGDRGAPAPIIDAPAPSDGFEEAWDRAIAALLEKNYDEALRAFEHAGSLRPGDSKVIANVERLRALGAGDGASSARNVERQSWSDAS